MLKKLNWCFEF